jgi:hypothetical protein
MDDLANRASSEDIIDVGLGDDFDTEFEPFSRLRPDGVPLRIGVDQDRSTVAISPSTPAVRSWLGRDSAMAEQADAHELALALDRTGDLYAVQMAFGDFEMRPSLFDTERGAGFGIDDIVITEPFTALGVGWSGIGDTQRTSIAYVFESDDAAFASALAIETLFQPDTAFFEDSGSATDQTMGSVFELDEITTAGRTVTVTGTASRSRPRPLPQVGQALSVTAITGRPAS